MSDLMRFMMMIIALALLSFLNSGNSHEKRGEATRSVVLSPENKLPV